MDLHNQSILFQTVTQPNKLTVTSPYERSLLSKTHAIGLQRDTSIQLIFFFYKLPDKNEQ